MISSLIPAPSLSDPARRLLRPQLSPAMPAPSSRTRTTATAGAPTAAIVDPAEAARRMREQAQAAVADRPRPATGPLGLPVEVGTDKTVGGWNNRTGGNFGSYVRTATGERVGAASAWQNPQTGAWERKPLAGNTAPPTTPGAAQAGRTAAIVGAASGNPAMQAAGAAATLASGIKRPSLINGVPSALVNAEGRARTEPGTLTDAQKRLLGRA